MAKHNFLVERYQITLGDHPKTFGGVEVRPRGVVACFGEFLRLIYYFLPEGAETARPRATMNGARWCLDGSRWNIGFPQVGSGWF